MLHVWNLSLFNSSDCVFDFKSFFAPRRSIGFNRDITNLRSTQVKCNSTIDSVPIPKLNQRWLIQFMSLSTIQWKKKLVWIGYSGYAIKWKKVQLIKAYCRPSCHIHSKQQTWAQSSNTHFFIRALSTVFFISKLVSTQLVIRSSSPRIYIPWQNVSRKKKMFSV